MNTITCIRKVSQRMRCVSSIKFNSSKSVNNNQFIVHSPYPNEAIPNISINNYVWRNLERWPERIALECTMTGRQYSYSKTNEICTNLARFFINKMGLKKGDVIAAVLPNCPEYPILSLSAMQAGLVLTLINPSYTAEEVSKQLLDSDSKLIITISSMWNTINNAQQIIKINVPVVAVKVEKDAVIPSGAIDFFEICESNNYDANFDDWAPEDLAFLPYSSGTTGLPKGVELAHKNIVSNLCQMNSPNVKLNVDTTSSHQDVVPLVLPAYHFYGHSIGLLAGLSEGCKIVTVPKFDPEIFIQMLVKHKPNIIHLAPPIVLFLINSEQVQMKHLESLRVILSGAAPLSDSDVERFSRKFPNTKIIQAYGMTEASPLTHMQSLTKQMKCGGCGFAVPNTLCKIVSLEDGKTSLGPNETGELLIKGPQIMKGYLKNTEATKETVVDDGWLRSGDIAHYDETGEFFVTDRLKELIKVKGFQVAPAELEGVIRAHPEVADVAVTGINHPRYGEVPKAFVVRKKGSVMQEDDLKDYMAKKVASYKQLSGGVVFLEQIPKSAAGKILRRQLKNL